MRSLVIAALITAAILPQAWSTPPLRLDVTAIVRRVSEANFLVRENALKVYQARTQIEVARASLLPRLNLWGLLKIKLDPLAILDQITDIAPFLVPANWFRLEEIKLLHLAESEGYRALWGNELHSAKALYARVLLDREIRNLARRALTDLERLHRIALTRETFGGVAPGTARNLEIRVLTLREDVRSLELLSRQEEDALTLALGIPSGVSLDLEPLTLPDLSGALPLPTSELEFRVLSTSPERRQFDHFLSALSRLRSELEYSFLGASSVSRGVAGGIFDGLPEGDAWGFATGPSLRIVSTQREVLLVRKAGVEEILKRQLHTLALQHDAEMAGTPDARRRALLAQAGWTQALSRLETGQEVALDELTEALELRAQAETALLSLGYRAWTALDRLDRLTWRADYARMPLVPKGQPEERQ